jgi:hypothetical protein
MTTHSIKRFKLAVAVVLSFGLGMARVLPVQAAVLAKPIDPLRSRSQPLDSYQFQLDDLTLRLPSAAKPQARVAQTALESPSWSTETPAPRASRAARGDAAKGQGASYSEGFFSLVFFTTIVFLIYKLISSGKSVAAASLPGPATAPSSPAAAAITTTETIAPPALVETESDEPVAVPTPALLPGLLGLSLKLFRQKKAEPLSTAL